MSESKDIEGQLQKNDEKEQQKHGCCQRFKAQMKMSSCQLEDHGGTLDLEESFGPRTWFALLIKYLFWGLTMGDFVYSWAARDNPGFYLAYLSHWAEVYALAYFSLSTAHSLGATKMWLINSSWILYSVAAVHQAAVALLFWSLSYDPDKNPLDYNNIMTHGGVMLLVLLEGNLVNKVPIRLKHVIWSMLMAFIFIIWTVLQNVVIQYNPDSDEGDEDDSIYTALKWREDTAGACILSAMVVFVAFPGFHALFWTMSLRNRRYTETEPTVDGVMKDREELE